MMLAYRLVRLIETHSDALAAGLLEKVQHSELTTSVKAHVPADDLKQRVYEIYRHLGEWLLAKSAFDIELRYKEIGERRAQQGVPISELIWTIVLTKENLWEFLKNQDLLQAPAEVLGELEVLQMLEQFFERAIYYAAVGHEHARSGKCAPQASSAAN